MELDYKSIGKRVKIARIKAELTQNQLSETADMSPTHLSNIETGTTRVSLCAIVNLANALNVTCDELLCGNIIKAKPEFERELAQILSDCDEYEIRVIRDVAEAVKESLRRDSYLRKMNRNI